MKRFGLCVAFVLFTAAALNAQLLWEISGNGLSKKSYLFGTHHLVSVDFLDSIPGVFKAFDACRMVVGEVVVNDPTMLKRITDGARMPTHTQMRSLFSETDYAKVDSALRVVLNMGLSDLALLKPAMISNLYMLAYYQQLFPRESNEWQLDSFFQQIAEQNNIPVMGLETVDDQIALLYNSQTLERQAFLLVGMVEQSDRAADEIVALNRLYRKGDLDGLLSLYENDTTKYAPTQQEMFGMLGDRNDTWARTLPKLMNDQPCFIVVGALHLPGENGLIALLRKAGYKVKPVKK
ncbi:MAG: TraB/GumN family protein [Paludibacteraceae bacterium]